jgi:hypothetical protein
MTTATIHRLAKETRSMTLAEGLAFVERTRRQLNRFNQLPTAPGQTIAPEDAAEIRVMCDDLEADINKSLSGG